MKNLISIIVTTFSTASFTQYDNWLQYQHFDERSYVFSVTTLDGGGNPISPQTEFLFFHDSTNIEFSVDTLDFSDAYKIFLSGSSNQYLRGDGAFTTFPTIPTNTNQLTNGAGFLLSSDIAGKLNISDTAAMLSPYLLEGAAAAAYATISGLNAKQNQLNGTGFVKVSGTTVSYDNSTYLTSEVDGSITNEIELPSQTGNAGKHLVTNGTSASWAAVKRQETYSGTTNGSGVYTVTFGTSYSVAPNIQVQIIGGTSNQVATCTVSTTGFTVTVVQRNAVTLLGTEVLLASTSNVSGAGVDVLITEK